MAAARLVCPSSLTAIHFTTICRIARPPQPRTAAVGFSRRSFAASTRTRSETVALVSERHDPSEASSLGAIVMLHGLFGSKQNWRSLSKAIARTSGRSDLRNHGDSPHAEPHDYTTMAADVARYLRENELQDVVLVGHSMGGKVAMAVALSPDSDHSERLDRFVSVDMAPSKGKISDDFAGYIDAFRAVQDAVKDGKVQTKSDADKIIAKWEPALPVRQFLLTNLQRSSSDQPFEWRIPVDILSRAIPAIGDFPYEAGERTFDRPTLFVKGIKSKYINRRNEPVLSEFFPNMRLEKLDTGHWVHSEKPHDFQKLLVDFAK